MNEVRESYLTDQLHVLGYLTTNIDELSQLLGRLNDYFPAIVKNAQVKGVSDVVGKISRKLSKVGQGRTELNQKLSQFLQLKSLISSMCRQAFYSIELHGYRISNESVLERLCMRFGLDATTFRNKIGTHAPMLRHYNIELLSSCALLGLIKHSMLDSYTYLNKYSHIVPSELFSDDVGRLDRFFSLVFRQDKLTSELFRSYRRALCIEKSEGVNPNAEPAAPDNCANMSYSEENSTFLNKYHKFHKIGSILSMSISKYSVFSSASSAIDKTEFLNRVEKSPSTVVKELHLAEFIRHFGLDTLITLLEKLRAWDQGENESLAQLQTLISLAFIQLLTKKHSVFGLISYPVDVETWDAYVKSGGDAFLAKVLTVITDALLKQVIPFEEFKHRMLSDHEAMERALKSFQVEPQQAKGGKEIGSAVDLTIKGNLGHNNNSCGQVVNLALAGKIGENNNNNSDDSADENSSHDANASNDAFDEASEESKATLAESIVDERVSGGKTSFETGLRSPRAQHPVRVEVNFFENEQHRQAPFSEKPVPNSDPSADTYNM